ncbi:recQ-mediated genome instability protein 1-like isoform X1 [Bombus vosnesenskii]|uniref:RecQ-mediated genome instability protein 1 n=1 Tax=Bombus vosnesenskii TaxID=207650 RepID=A0A6J3K619_9HYME|nr:recQ-mediated genome instability protein 1-like isoform X1 [Bombus vosnesenskii]
MNEDVFRRIKGRLKSEYYSMNNEWLRDCIEFYVNQHENPGPEKILQFVKEQWQLGDLRKINNENGCLPCNLSDQKFIILSGNYILQVEQMYDIATSKYKQLEHIRNARISEIDLSEAEKMEKWQPPKKRMIQLRLTDGLQDLIGIEYNYISRLNDMLLPGYKVMITGPLKCRKGVLLLEEGKLKGIGGEVDSLLIPNAMENVLARALNLSENPDPYSDNETKSNNIRPQVPQMDQVLFEEDFEVNPEDIFKTEDSHNKDRKKSKIKNTNTDVKRVQSYENEGVLNDNVHFQRGINNANTEIKRLLSHENEETLIDDECFQTETEFTSDQVKTDQSCGNEIILDDDDCFLEMVDEEQFTEASIEQKSIALPFRTLPKEGSDDIIVITDEKAVTDVKYDAFRETREKDSSHLNFKSCTAKADSSISRSKIEKKQKSLLSDGKKRVSTSPRTTIASKKGRMDKQITEFIKGVNAPEEPKICEFIYDINNEIITTTTFKTIRGHVQVLGKLTKQDPSWILQATIADGTGTIEVSFSNKILENLLGFSVREFSLKKKLRKKNPEIEHELRMSFRNAEKEMKALDALLKLELNRDERPTVIEITDLTQEQKEIIDRRVKAFLLENNV